MPTGRAIDRHWEQNRDLLIEAARNAGIDPAVVVKISGFESSFDPGARPVDSRHPERNRVRQFDGTMATSSAYGLGQFTDDTWLSTLRRHGSKYGVHRAEQLTLPEANAPALRTDARLQAAMLAEFTRDNMARGEHLGGTDPEANVYALHNLGAGDGPRFLEALRAHPDTPVNDVLSSRVVRGNPALYGDGSRTLSEAYRVMGAKMDEYSDYASRISGAPHVATATASQAPSTPERTARSGSESIYHEARAHFLDGPDRFEYGRGDIARASNRSPNGLTDQSRNERDLDGDGLKGVDCSSFVWRALRNAGYDVPTVPFTSRTLFDGERASAYSRQHFDVIASTAASRDRGALRPGDILLFKSNHGDGQHVGVFEGYDAQGHIHFIGSQTTTGPAEASAPPGSYWNGRDFHIVGALRAKPEFQVRAPLHAASDEGVRHHPLPGAPNSTAHTGDARAPHSGNHGPVVATLQRRLFELGYRGEDGKPLGVDGDFGRNTAFALKQFQREHGIEGKGIAGPKTAAALDRAEAGLMTHPSHPQHRLYEQALEKVRAAETARGIPVGPHSERIAAALAVECVREGLQRIDRVEISTTGKLVWGIEDRPGGRESGLGRTDGISLAQASRQPLAESAQQAQQVAVNTQAQREDLQCQHVQSAPAMAR